MEAVIIALISLLGGSGGVAVIVRAVLDHKANKVSRESDIDERFTQRLEERLARYESRIDELEDDLAEERRYTTALSVALARAGHDVPAREGTYE